MKIAMSPNRVKILIASVFALGISITGGFGQTVYAAKLYFFPQTADVVVGENIIVELRLDTEGEIINAAEIQGSLSNKNAEILSLNESNSIFQIFVEQPKVEENKFTLIGGIPGGFNGVGIVAKLNIQGNTNGKAVLSLDRNSRMLLNSENADRAMVIFSESEINIIQQNKDYIKVTSHTHADQSRWYNTNKVNIHWDLEPGVEYSYLVSRDPIGEPDNEPDKPEGTLQWMGDIELSDLKDGIYYFSVKKVGASTVSRYLIKIDTVAPELKDARANSGISETDYKDFISFLAEDEMSGIDYYEIQLDDKTPEIVVSPYITLSPYTKAIVRAYDKAGNTVEKEIERSPQEANIALIGTIFTIGVLIALFLLMRGRRKVSE